MNPAHLYPTSIAPEAAVLDVHQVWEVVLQGQLEVTTLAGTGAAASREDDLVETKPFFLLSLDLPPARLFQDAMQEQIIPQVLSCSPPPADSANT